VADSVEVFSRNAQGQGVRWVSDGSGEYEVSTVDNLDFTRGTKIVLKLKPESREFAREAEVEKILRKYSLFITYPIKLNGQLINNLQAIWYRDKREVTEDEYERFFEHLANTKIPYKFKLHYSTDVPLAIKALFYIPGQHSERMGLTQETGGMHLYCRKVLIKENCQELLPSYLRFVKGVVDCEDLPLNISRETYQDSALIAKLRNVVTRRVLKLLEDELKRDASRYDAWFDQFNQFLKEGLMMDSENKEALMKLMRYPASFTDSKSLISMDDYVKKMKAGQEKIYYVSAPNKEAALGNPFMEPFKGTDAPPVLIVTNNVDEICFQQIG
jgi:TNF receptor-associated protein 1